MHSSLFSCLLRGGTGKSLNHLFSSFELPCFPSPLFSPNLAWRFLLVLATGAGYQFLVVELESLLPNGEGEGELLVGRDQCLAKSQTLVNCSFHVKVCQFSLLTFSLHILKLKCCCHLLRTSFHFDRHTLETFIPKGLERFIESWADLDESAQMRKERAFHQSLHGLDFKLCFKSNMS